MFLASLSQEEKEMFIMLAQQMIEADGKIQLEEKTLLSLYLHEMDMEEKTITLRKLEEYLPFLSKTGKKSIYLELLALALIDKDYPREEQALINKVREMFFISQSESDKLFAWTKNYMTMCDDGWLLVNE